MCANVAGIDVFVIRSADGVLRGFLNQCRHRGAILLDAQQGCTHALRCPYHNWVYADTGALLRAPAFGPIDVQQWPLHPIAVATWRGLVFAALDPIHDLETQTAPLDAEFANDSLEKFRPYRSERLVFEANWKIYTDNFVEGYHIPGIHPAFFEAIDFAHFKTVVLDGLVKMTAPVIAELFYEGRWYGMWPNWTLSLFGGGFSTSRINPLSSSRTELIHDFYFSDSPENTTEHRDQTIALNLDVIREDFSICADVHATYTSGTYEPGPLSSVHESGVDYFQRRYLDVLS